MFRSPLDPRRGRLVIGPIVVPCALGRAGPGRSKREGDGRTPIGTFRVLAVWYRPDRGPRPRTGVPVRRIRPDQAWCDDPESAHYNRPVKLPFGPSHERMWRDDALYDLVLDLSYNRRPVIRGGGSAIFLHVAREGLRPTEGCVAVPRGPIRRLVERIGPRTKVSVES